jgi:hypothetical protein
MRSIDLWGIIFVLLAIVFALGGRATGEPLLYVIAAFFSVGLIYIRSQYSMQTRVSGVQVMIGAETRQKGDMVEVTVIQNGPFETVPSGSGWYKLGTSIELKAFPVKSHAFKAWTCDAKSIEIPSPFSASTRAIVRGPGTITANFY